MAKQPQEFIEAAQKAAQEAGQVFDDLPEEQQELLILYITKLYYEQNPEEAQEILDSEE